ncbi:uncharacterized protein A4U43_C08F28870 [Asparagus officinalis]|nr:uncharacterized protein A4U43_C08F28870 [Asparagus officinalis]
MRHPEKRLEPRQEPLLVKEGHPSIAASHPTEGRAGWGVNDTSRKVRRSVLDLDRSPTQSTATSLLTISMLGDDEAPRALGDKINEGGDCLTHLSSAIDDSLPLTLGVGMELS